MLKSNLSFLCLLQWVALSRSDPCTLCKNSTSNIILSYEKELNIVTANESLIHNCSELENYVAVLEATSQECAAYQSIGTLCGCPEPENACLFCSSLNEMGDATYKPRFPFTQGLPFNPTCEMVQAMGKYHSEAGTHQCQRELQFYSYLCGCPFIFQKRQNILEWLPRVSATLSFLGSSFIVQDILKSQKKHAMTYHQIIIAMSVVDMLSSIAWALSVIPLPSEELGPSGARGNHATCKAQGFFIEFGLTSPFFNLALSIYYVLVVKYGWKEDRVSKKRPYLLGLPLLCGLGIALAGIPHYGPDISMCYVDQSADDNYLLPLVFLFAPIFLVILFGTIAVIIVYWSVRQKERASRRWTMRTDHHPNLERKVFLAITLVPCFFLCFMASGNHSPFRGHSILQSILVSLLGYIPCSASGFFEFLGLHSSQIAATAFFHTNVLNHISEHT